MLKEIIADGISSFVDFVRKQLSVDPMLAAPAVILMISWPMFQVLFDDRPQAFMSAFVLAMAVRLGLRFDIVAKHLGKSAAPRMVAALVLLQGPGLMGALIWMGEPIWCQRFLSIYFVCMAVLHLLDLLSGAHRMIKVSWPALILPRAELLMSQVLVIYYMGLFLLNETLIAQVDPAVWLLYFGILPLLSRMVLKSLFETVRVGTQGLV